MPSTRPTLKAWLQAPARPFLAWLSAGLLGSAAAAAPAGTTLQHGPFEIVALTRRISTGTFPNIGGSPFAKREVSDFLLRWRGREVEVPGLGRRFWRVLRLADAPRPALLLVRGNDFTLVSEHQGQLQLQRVGSASNTLAEAQWLDSAAGRQPGPSMRWGIEKSELASGSLLQGGRWLRLGSRRVLDVQRLELHKVEPWVPMQPGQPLTSLSREGDEARAFSPGAGHYVLAGSQIDYARGRGQVHGLLVVDIAAGSARELRVDRRQMPFADLADLDAAWIAHYFLWQRDASGREQLQPRPGAPRRPWRGRLEAAAGSAGELSYRVERVRPGFVDELQRIVLAALPGASLVAPTTDAAADASPRTVRLGACLLGLAAYGGSPVDELYDGRVVVYPMGHDAASRRACQEAISRVAAAVDAELASGRHERWIVLDD